MLTTLASKFFSKTDETSARPRRASAIRKQQVLRQSASYYGDVYTAEDVYEEQNPWVAEEVATPVVAAKVEVKVSAQVAEPSVTDLLKKLAVTVEQSAAQAPEIRAYSSLFPPPPLANNDRHYAVGSGLRRGRDFGVGLPPAA